MTADHDGGPGATVATTAERGGRLAAIGIAFGWHLVMNLSAIVAAWPDFRVPWAAGVGWLLYAAVGVVAALRLYGRVRVPTTPLIAVLLYVQIVAKMEWADVIRLTEENRAIRHDGIGSKAVASTKPSDDPVEGDRVCRRDFPACCG